MTDSALSCLDAKYKKKNILFFLLLWGKDSFKPSLLSTTKNNYFS